MAVSAQLLGHFAPVAEADRQTMTVAEAAERLGVSPSAARKFVERAGLSRVQAPVPGLSDAVDVADVEAAVARKADHVARREAAVILGLPGKKVDLLTADGLLEVVPMEQRVLETECYSRSAMTALLDRCVAGAQPMSAETADAMGLLSLADLAARHRSDAWVLRLLFRGRLTADGRIADLPGFQAMRFRRQHVDAAKRQTGS